MSPYLFIICVEGLSSLVRKYETKQLIQGIRICKKAPKVSHMLFADDNYIFCRETTEERQSLLDLLAKYEMASGQKINSSKSQIFFSKNVIQYNKSLICQKLLMEETDDRSKYLGLPNILGRHKTSILGFVKN